MADEHQAVDLMQYDKLAQDALRGVIVAALKQAASPAGLPGQHHLYITFKTRAPDVKTPPDLLERYPDEMTIVLQHQFWDLVYDETSFAVTLRFGGQPKRLYVPFVAITQFFDPSVQFLLKWPEPDIVTAEVIEAPISHAHRTEPTTDGGASDAPDTVTKGKKIVSLDQFRKK